MARPSNLQKQAEYVHERPEAPSHLTPDQAAVWDDLFSTVAPEWIAPESYPLAAMYCQHVANSKTLAALIAANDAKRIAGVDGIAAALGVDPLDGLQFDLAGWFKLHAAMLRALDKENRAASSLATRLRITTQALRTADHSPATRNLSAEMPWEEDEEYVMDE